MQSSNGKPRSPSAEVEKRSAWGWLTLALTTGLLASRCRPKTRLFLGLGWAALGCCQTKRSTKLRKEDEELKLTAEPSLPKEESPRAVATSPGNWLLQVEPLPSVVEEGNRGLEMLGQGGSMLGEQPWIALEEPCLIDENAWLNQGAEIPDSVELPDLLGTPEPESQTGAQGS